MNSKLIVNPRNNPRKSQKSQEIVQSVAKLWRGQVSGELSIRRDLARTVARQAALGGPRQSQEAYLSMYTSMASEQVPMASDHVSYGIPSMESWHESQEFLLGLVWLLQLFYILELSWPVTLIMASIANQDVNATSKGFSIIPSDSY